MPGVAGTVGREPAGRDDAQLPWRGKHGRASERVVPLSFVSAWCGSRWHDGPICTAQDVGKLTVRGPSNSNRNSVAQHGIIVGVTSGLWASRYEHTEAELCSPQPGTSVGCPVWRCGVIVMLQCGIMRPKINCTPPSCLPGLASGRLGTRALLFDDGTFPDGGMPSPYRSEQAKGCNAAYREAVAQRSGRSPLPDALPVTGGLGWSLPAFTLSDPVQAQIGW